MSPTPVEALQVGSLHQLVARADVTPNTFQTNTIIAACVMFIAIIIAWNLPILRDIIAALKLLVVGIHEMCHLAVGLMCGGQIVSICIDPNDGGATHIMNLMRTFPRVPRDPYAMPTYSQLFWSPSAVATLAAGYIGSSILGFVFIFCAFDIVASKVAALVIHFGLLVPILRADHWVAFVSVVICEALLIGLWFGDHGSALRFYVLWVGMMNLFYVVWDYIDERLLDKRNTSDCAQFSELLGWPTSAWAMFWFIYEALVFTAAVFAGICVFKRSDEEMYAEAMPRSTQGSTPRVEQDAYHSGTYAAAGAAMMSFKSINQIHQQLCAFHVYAQDPSRIVEAHHFCTHLRKDLHQCVIYDRDAEDARLIGIEYLVPEAVFERLPDEEKTYWHSHKFEVDSGMLMLGTKSLVPNAVTDVAERPAMLELHRTYGKTIHTWAYDEHPDLPLGPPNLMMAFTKDEQVPTDRLEERDERLGVSTEAKRELRRGYLRQEDLDRAPLPGGDVYLDGKTSQFKLVDGAECE